LQDKLYEYAKEDRLVYVENLPWTLHGNDEEIIQYINKHRYRGMLMVKVETGVEHSGQSCFTFVLLDKDGEMRGVSPLVDGLDVLAQKLDQAEFWEQLRDFMEIKDE